MTWTDNRETSEVHRISGRREFHRVNRSYDDKVSQYPYKEDNRGF